MRRGIDAEIRTRVESFASELTELIARLVLSAAERALGTERRRADDRPAAKRRDAAVLTPLARRHDATPPRVGPPLSFEHYERMAIERALDEAGGNKGAAAELLRIGTSTLYRKLARHGLTGSAPSGTTRRRRATRAS